MDRTEAEELLRTLFADPVAARSRALADLVDDPDPAVASIGHQIVGIVQRDVGQTDDALAHLRRALALARRADGEREADVRATLGASLLYIGRARDGLAQLERAVQLSSGVNLARVLVRRAVVLGFRLERLEDAAADLARALAILEEADDDVWLARALHLDGWTRATLGDMPGARRSSERALAIHAALGFRSDVAVGVHNRGWFAFLDGDLPQALEHYADASRRYAEIGETSIDLVYDQCSAYVAAGLASDALEVVEDALVARALLEVEEADLLLARAETALAAGDDDRAREAADRACRLFRTQGRRQHWIRAELMAVASRAEGHSRPGRLLSRAGALVDAAREAGAPELPDALYVAARIAGQVRSPAAREASAAWLEEAGTFRASDRATTRALAWLATGRLRQLTDDRAGVLRACERGLAALDEHRATFGSQELHATSSARGADLADLGTRTALAGADPRRLLRWAERWRATALSVPSRVVHHDASTPADLAALRAQYHRIAEARVHGAPTARLEARAARLERTARQRMLHARGSGEAAGPLDVGALLDALREDDTVLVELVEVDGVLHTLVAGRRRVRHRVVGDAAAASRAVDFALFTLRQAARGRRAQVDVAGRRLQDALLGRALDGVGEARVVVSPTASLQGVPWGMLPALADRPVTSTPSARLWLRARSATPASARRVLVVGPGLGSGGAEVRAVAAQDHEAQVLDGSGATVTAALAGLDGAELAHVAAHGSFREDSPLFSSLTLADGPLLVHDLQQLHRPPHRVVLSACESGVLAPVGDQELLGLSAALLSMGTAGVVSALAEVDDAATVEVMVALHAALRRGSGLGEALLAARSAAEADPLLAATAASFTAMGT